MANEPTISEMNEAIARFVGMELKQDKDDPGFEWEWINGPNKSFWPSKTPPPYHTSWDWLMPVVEKIASLDNEKYCFHISSAGQWACYIDRDDVFDSEICSYGGFEPMIFNVHKAIYKFIQWYNKNANDARKQNANS